MTVTLFKDNRSPSLFDTVRIADVAFNLTGLTVKLQMRPKNDVTLVVDAVAAVNASASTLVGDVSLPERTLTVANAAGFLPRGALLVDDQIVEYEEISNDSFLGCEGGAGSVTSGAAVAQIGGVSYAWQAADVDTAGDYTAWWHVVISGSNVQDTPEFDVEILAHAPTQRGLCTLEEIQEYVPGYVAHSDHATDAVLRQLIASVSTELQNDMEREVLPVVANPSAKTFDLSAWEAAERKMWVGDLADVDPTDFAVEITQLDGTVVASLTMADDAVIALPRNRQEWQPFNYLWFPSELADAPSLAPGYVVEVIGNWGFPAVPADIKSACIRLVLMRYLGNPANSGTSLNDALLAAGFDIAAAFASARATVESYEFLTIA